MLGSIIHGVFFTYSHIHTYILKIFYLSWYSNIYSKNPHWLPTPNNAPTNSVNEDPLMVINHGHQKTQLTLYQQNPLTTIQQILVITYEQISFTIYQQHSLEIHGSQNVCNSWPLWPDLNLHVTIGAYNGK